MIVKDKAFRSTYIHPKSSFMLNPKVIRKMYETIEKPADL